MEALRTGSMGLSFVVGAALLLVVKVLPLLLRRFKRGSGWSDRSSDSTAPKIPAGSSGWPLIGETLSFANADPLAFVIPRVKKYGPVFRSNLVGVDSIVVTTPDMARFVYSESSLFRASYPSMIATLVGRESLSSCEPERHPVLKRHVHRNLMPDTLRHGVGRMEGYVLDALSSWDERVVQTSAEIKEFTLNTSVYFIFGLSDIKGSAEAQILINAYKAVTQAFYAIPINLPGFPWHNALKQRKLACDYLGTLISKNRQEADEGKPCNSVLRSLVSAVDEKGQKLSNSEIIDSLVGTLFGGHDTTATTLTWVIKFLTENPEVRRAVEAEQEEIRRSKAPGEPLTWEDTRRMEYSQHVVQETLRNPTVLQFTCRAATQDVVYKGYLIPKGWRVFVMSTAIHLDPGYFPAPEKFDPSRFNVAPKSGTYLPFGAGKHICPGSELAKMTVLVFIHHFVTKFSWESVAPDMGKQFKPFPWPVGGYPIKVYRK